MYKRTQNKYNNLLIMADSGDESTNTYAFVPGVYTPLNTLKLKNLTSHTDCLLRLSKSPM